MDNPIEKLVWSAMSQIRDSLGMRVFITYFHSRKKCSVYKTPLGWFYFHSKNSTLQMVSVGQLHAQSNIRSVNYTLRQLYVPEECIRPRGMYTSPRNVLVLHNTQRCWKKLSKRINTGELKFSPKKHVIREYMYNVFTMTMSCNV